MSSDTRQEFIRAAVTFLQNPKLSDSSLKDKLQFLKEKGLSEVEVNEALNLALINRHQSQNGKWNFFLILGLCLGGYRLYKAYQEARELNLKKQNETYAKILEEQENHKEKSTTLDEILEKIGDLKKLIELQRNNFATDLQSLKTLLLGSERFAAPPVIPAWQLKDSNSKSESKDSSLINKKSKKKNDSTSEDTINDQSLTKPSSANLD